MKNINFKNFIDEIENFWSQTNLIEIKEKMLKEHLDKLIKDFLKTISIEPSEKYFQYKFKRKDEFNIEIIPTNIHTFLILNQFDPNSSNIEILSNDECIIKDLNIRISILYPENK